MRGTHAECELQCMQLQQGKTPLCTVELRSFQMREGVPVSVCLCACVRAPNAFDFFFLKIIDFTNASLIFFFISPQRKSTAVIISLLNHCADPLTD